MFFENNNYTSEQLLTIDEMNIKEQFVKLVVLDWNENPIKEIQGVLTGGNININGNSSIRRTCNFNFITTEEKEIEDYIKLNTKFKLFIGLKNNLPEPYYSEIGEDIIWFKQGVYIFITASFSKSINGVTINVTAKDKGCLINGEVGGTIPETAVFHELIEESENGEIFYSPVLIFDIVQEIMHHYGNEKLSNILISDIPNKIRQLMTYSGNRPIYLEKNEDGDFTGNYTFSYNADYSQFTFGDQIGYTVTDFTYPGELIAQPGDSVSSILDKIVNVLGNFEYFYDIDGVFHFQEKRNYLNNSFKPVNSIKDINLKTIDYQANFDAEETIYSFKNNKKLITAISNNPNYNNIKNDFVVWGVKKNANGLEIPIRYHLAIDHKPQPQDKEDWRETIYDFCQQTGDIQQNQEGYMYYKKELDAEWRKIYSENHKWLFNNPQELNFFLDFIDDSSVYGEYSVNNIGRRTYSEVNNDCVYVFNKEIPDIIFTNSQEEQEELIASGNYKYVAIANNNLLNFMHLSSVTQTCFDRIRELLYQHLVLNETISISCLPIYYLEVNRKIEVEDMETKIFGDYIINSISIPLNYNGTMTIQATRALSRI